MSTSTYHPITCAGCGKPIIEPSFTWTGTGTFHNHCLPPSNVTFAPPFGGLQLTEDRVRQIVREELELGRTPDMHSDFSLLDSSSPGTSSKPLADIAPAVSAMSSPKGASCTSFHTQKDVGSVPQDPPLTPAKRLEMVAHAQALADYYEAEYRLFWTLWTRDGGIDFDHKLAYDLALANFHKVCELRDSLKKGIKQ